MNKTALFNSNILHQNYSTFPTSQLMALEKKQKNKRPHDDETDYTNDIIEASPMTSQVQGLFDHLENSSHRPNSSSSSQSSFQPVTLSSSPSSPSPVVRPSSSPSPILVSTGTTSNSRFPTIRKEEEGNGAPLIVPTNTTMSSDDLLPLDDGSSSPPIFQRNRDYDSKRRRSMRPWEDTIDLSDHSNDTLSTTSRIILPPPQIPSTTTRQSLNTSITTSPASSAFRCSPLRFRIHSLINNAQNQPRSSIENHSHEIPSFSLDPTISPTNTSSILTTSALASASVSAYEPRISGRERAQLELQSSGLNYDVIDLTSSERTSSEVDEDFHHGHDTNSNDSDGNERKTPFSDRSSYRSWDEEEEEEEEEYLSRRERRRRQRMLEETDEDEEIEDENEEDENHDYDHDEPEIIYEYSNRGNRPDGFGESLDVNQWRRESAIFDHSNILSPQTRRRSIDSISGPRLGRRTENTLTTSLLNNNNNTSSTNSSTTSNNMNDLAFYGDIPPGFWEPHRIQRNSSTHLTNSRSVQPSPTQNTIHVEDLTRFDDMPPISLQQRAPASTSPSVSRTTTTTAGTTRHLSDEDLARQLQEEEYASLQHPNMAMNAATLHRILHDIHDSPIATTSTNTNTNRGRGNRRINGGSGNILRGRGGTTVGNFGRGRGNRRGNGGINQRRRDRYGYGGGTDDLELVMAQLGPEYAFMLGGGLASHPGNYVPEGSFNDDYESLLALSERIGEVKVKRVSDQVIQNLPTTQYSATNGKSNEDESKCTICLMDYENGESVKLLPCSHRFHDVCISQWLKNNTRCPICRYPIEE